MLKKAVKLLRGSVCVRAKSAYPERMLNLCSARGIEFWDVRWIDDTALSFCVARGDLRALRRAAEAYMAQHRVRLEPPFDLIPPPVQCRRMLCASRNDDYSVASVPGRPSARPIALLPLLFAVLDLLVLLDQAKSTRKTEKGENFPIDSSGRIPRFRRCIRRPFSFPDFSQGGAMGALRSHCLRYFSYL